MPRLRERHTLILPEVVMPQKIKLQGFNNLTKSLSFCIYDICYAETPEQQAEYIQYIDEK